MLKAFIQRKQVVVATFGDLEIVEYVYYLFIPFRGGVIRIKL